MRKLNLLLTVAGMLLIGGVASGECLTRADFVRGCVSAIQRGPTLEVAEVASEGCEITGWTYRPRNAESVYIQGATTCAAGRLNIQYYSGGRFLGSDTLSIRGFGFHSHSYIAVTPDEMTIRYTIDPR